VQLGASWQDSFSEKDIRFALIEGRVEGRLPIAPGRSVLIAQASTVLAREDSGTEPLPFYLYPRIGGSTTLRGFQLDRFYGRNMIAATLEYRVAIHPNMEFQIFFDEGQIFQHTEDLKFLDWHRNYGVGLRFRNRTGTQFRIEFASSAERFTIHVSFGGRPPRPLIGPVRYPNYRP
jgi:outer membrane protein assembly factor BamA